MGEYLLKKREEEYKKLIFNVEDQIEYQENNPFETIQAKETRRQLLEFYQNQLKDYLQNKPTR
jgi:hypothetical protein